MLDTRSASGSSSAGLGKQRIITRQYATASEGVAVKEEDVEEQEARKPSSEGPIPEYNARVKAGTLRDDPFQRGRLVFRDFIYWKNQIGLTVL